MLLVTCLRIIRELPHGVLTCGLLATATAEHLLQLVTLFWRRQVLYVDGVIGDMSKPLPVILLAIQQ